MYINPRRSKTYRSARLTQETKLLAPVFSCPSRKTRYQLTKRCSDRTLVRFEVGQAGFRMPFTSVQEKLEPDLVCLLPQYYFAIVCQIGGF